MNDLLGDVIVIKQKKSKPEAAALREVIRTLSTHPKVAWVERMNSGVAQIGLRWVKFGFKGCPDVIGQLVDGRFIGVEVKSDAGILSQEQAAFITMIKQFNGVAFVAKIVVMFSKN